MPRTRKTKSPTTSCELQQPLIRHEIYIYESVSKGVARVFYQEFEQGEKRAEEAATGVHTKSASNLTPTDGVSPKLLGCRKNELPFIITRAVGAGLGIRSRSRVMGSLPVDYSRYNSVQFRRETYTVFARKRRQRNDLGFSLSWFVARRSIQLSYGRADILFTFNRLAQFLVRFQPRVSPHSHPIDSKWLSKNYLPVRASSAVTRRSI